MGWRLTTVTFPFTPQASQFSLARKHGGEMVMQAVVHCIVSHCCVCVPGREWPWIARHRGDGCSLGGDLFRILTKSREWTLFYFLSSKMGLS